MCFLSTYQISCWMLTKAVHLCSTLDKQSSLSVGFFLIWGNFLERWFLGPLFMAFSRRIQRANLLSSRSTECGWWNPLCFSEHVHLLDFCFPHLPAFSHTVLPNTVVFGHFPPRMRGSLFSVVLF